MTDKKISELGTITQGDIASGDWVAVVDSSENATKKYNFGDTKTDVTDFFASTDTFTAGTYVRTRAEGFAYKAVDTATATTVENAGEQAFEVLPSGGKWDLRSFNAPTGGVTDAYAATQKAIDYVGGLGGGTITGVGLSYAIDGGNLENNHDHVFLEDFTFVRNDDTNTGWTLTFAANTETMGGGVQKAKFIGIPTLAPCAGLRMGTTTTKANSYRLNDIEATRHGQYGVGIGNGDYWIINNIRVLEHGLTSGSISSCMGFFIFPRVASQGGTVHDVTSVISAAAQANAGTNAAAIKLQTHQRLNATKLSAEGGSESCFVIDSITGSVSDVDVYPQGNNAGFNPGNNNPAHIFSGQTFTADDIRIYGGGTNAMVIGSTGVDGEYKLSGCKITRIWAPFGFAQFLNLSSYIDCVFSDWLFRDIRLDPAASSATANTNQPIRNVYENLKTIGGSLVLSASDSTASVLSSVSRSGAPAKTIQINGSDNNIDVLFSVGCDTNALVVDGDNNQIFGLQLSGHTTGRSVFCKTGSFGNIITGRGLANSGGGISDSGDNLIEGGSLITADFTDATSAINTVDKYDGKQAFDIITSRPVWASGGTPTSIWRYQDNSTAHTPA